MSYLSERSCRVIGIDPDVIVCQVAAPGNGGFRAGAEVHFDVDGVGGHDLFEEIEVVAG